MVRSGGVAGMVLTVEVDAAELDTGAAAELAGLVDACELRDGAPSAVADGFGYEVAVERDDGTSARARFGEGGAPPGAGELASWVVDGPHGHRRIGR